jgi:hypothetical protein
VHSRDSHLTFAVVWDPERGLEAYSGCDLLRLRPISDGNESFPESIRPDSRTLEDASLMSYDMASEPLRVLRHRKGRNFDSRERRPLGRGNVNDIYLQSLSNSSYTTASSFRTSRHKAPSKSSTSESASPSSIRTFAALWDPET